jgi:hypothetical protein
MKAIIIMYFVAATALFAAETNTVAPTSVTNLASVLQVELVEQARLVAEIAKEASHGFDSEDHAKSIRSQIEALLSKPAPAKPDVKADAVENTAPASDPTSKAPAITASVVTATPATTSATGPDPAALKEAVALLRREADRLEAQLQKLSRQP